MEDMKFTEALERVFEIMEGRPEIKEIKFNRKDDLFSIISDTDILMCVGDEFRKRKKIKFQDQQNEGLKNTMRLVRCISKVVLVRGKIIPSQLVVGKKYWIDDSTIRKDYYGDEYAQVYLDEAGKNRVGDMRTSYFETIYRYLNYGVPLSTYINTHTGFLLKDIISWCLNNPHHSLANHLIMYIHDNKLNTADNMEKEFVVNHVSAKEFAERGMIEKYMKYMGYSIQCVE